MVQAQPDHLIRLFLNLLDNAIKHTPEGGKVTLATPQVNDRVQGHHQRYRLWHSS